MISSIRQLLKCYENPNRLKELAHNLGLVARQQLVSGSIQEHLTAERLVAKCFNVIFCSDKRVSMILIKFGHKHPVLAVPQRFG